MIEGLRSMPRASAALLTLLLSAACSDEAAPAPGAAAGSGTAGTPTAPGTPAAGASGQAPATVPPPGRGTAGSGPSRGSSAGQTGGSAGASGSGSPSGGAAAGSSGAPAPAPAVDAGAAVPSADAAASDDAAPAPGAGSSMNWPPVTDFGADGTFTAMTEDASGPGGGYSLFYPTELGRDGLKHPTITWGNGAGTTPGLYSLLPLLATQGFVVIASNNSGVTGDEMIAGIDWLYEENGRDGSAFYQKLDPDKVASMGYSLGSLGTFEIAADPRIKTTVHISGGAMDKSVVPNLHNPAAFICGNDSDIAYANCETDFEMVTVPVFYANFPGDHFGILGTYATPINTVAATWLRWRLMNDSSLASNFVGPDCTLCKDSDWMVRQKDFDTAPP